GGPVDAPGPGHVIKARYTPSQVRVLAVEEEDSPHRAAVAACTGLDGLPVVCAELHSMVPGGAGARLAVGRGRAALDGAGGGGGRTGGGRRPPGGLRDDRWRRPAPGLLAAGGR